MNKHKSYFNQLIWSFLGLAFINTIEYFLLDIEYVQWLKITLLVSFTLMKMTLIGQLALKSIFNNVVAGVPYHIYLSYIFVAIFLFILSFAADYFFIYLIDNESYRGVVSQYGNVKIVFDFLFLSTMFFTMQGVMDLIPNCVLAEMYILFESLATYISFIFFLSNFSSLRKTLRVLRRD